MQHGSTFPFAVMYISDVGRRHADHGRAANSGAASTGSASLEPRSVTPRSLSRFSIVSDIFFPYVS